MKKVVIYRNSHPPKEDRALYIYFDHKFKSHRIIRPDMERFEGDPMSWRNLAYAIEPNLYKYVVK